MCLQLEIVCKEVIKSKWGHRVRPWYNRIRVFCNQRAPSLCQVRAWQDGSLLQARERVLTRTGHAGTLILTLWNSEGKWMSVVEATQSLEFRYGSPCWLIRVRNRSMWGGKWFLGEQQMFPPQVAEQWSRQPWFPAHRELNLLIWLVAFSFSILLATKPQVIISFEFCVLGWDTEKLKA